MKAAESCGFTGPATDGCTAGAERRAGAADEGSRSSPDVVLAAAVAARHVPDRQVHHGGRLSAVGTVEGTGHAPVATQTRRVVRSDRLPVVLLAVCRGWAVGVVVVRAVLVGAGRGDPRVFCGCWVAR